MSILLCVYVCMCECTCLCVHIVDWEIFMYVFYFRQSSTTKLNFHV